MNKISYICGGGWEGGGREGVGEGGGGGSSTVNAGIKVPSGFQIADNTVSKDQEKQLTLVA